MLHPIAQASEILPNNLISLSSPTGLEILRRNLNVDLLKLLSNFTTQDTPTYCGIASLVMVFNTMNIQGSPIIFKNTDLHYFSQENFFNKEVNKIILKEEILKNGMKLDQLKKIVDLYYKKNEMFPSNTINYMKFKNIIISSLNNKKYIIANFLRSKIGEKGGGHFSPVAAYDKETDRFLVLDVSRYKYPAVWVTASDLWNAVNTFDDTDPRGFLVIN